MLITVMIIIIMNTSTKAMITIIMIRQLKK